MILIVKINLINKTIYRLKFGMNIKIYTTDKFHNNSQMNNSHLAKPCVYQE